MSAIQNIDDVIENIIGRMDTTRVEERLIENGERLYKLMEAKAAIQQHLQSQYNIKQAQNNIKYQQEQMSDDTV